MNLPDKIDEILTRYATYIYSSAPDFFIATGDKYDGMDDGQAKQAITTLIKQAEITRAISELRLARPRDWKAYDGSANSDEELGYQKGIYAQIKLTQREIDEHISALEKEGK